MRIGMLWFDNDTSKKLETVISEATGYYQSKYHKAATLVVTNPVNFPGNETDETFTLGLVTIKKSRSVMPNHYWLGIE